jgi:hypothetical protein
VTFPLTCGLCGHADTVPVDPDTAIYTCDQCGGRIAYGASMPRIVTNVHPEDGRFVVSHVTHGFGDKHVDLTLTLDKAYAAQFALDLLSVCDPAAVKALHAAVVAAAK